MLDFVTQFGVLHVLFDCYSVKQVFVSNGYIPIMGAWGRRWGTFIYA